MRVTSVSIVLFLVPNLLSACVLPPLGRAVSTPTEFVAEASPTPAPEEPVVLTVCMGQEPSTLYRHADQFDQAARTILSVIHEGPYDTLGYEYQPVILTRVPSLQNGDAQINEVPVQEGDPVVDAGGQVMSLEAGMLVRPSGCRSEDCAITYDGVSPLKMDQMVVTFHLRPDLNWSDGVPLTAEDSVYAFALASSIKDDPMSYVIERTQTYEAADETTLQWWGVPGFIDPAYVTNVWPPAPKQAWGEFSQDQLSSVDVAARFPPGWGAYQMEEWVSGDHLRLVKNPYYFRAAEGYPRADVLDIRFLPDPDSALGEFIAGRCDILDPSIDLDRYAALLQELQAAEQAKVFFSTGLNIEWLGLGLEPASYDDGHISQTERPDIFGDLHTRQAIAYCLDRQAVVENVLLGLSSVPLSYVPMDHPLYDANIDPVPYDPQMGMELLNQAGWQDLDADPATPLQAVNVKNVPYKSPLELNYYVSSSPQRRQTAEILRQSLSACGIRVNVQYLTPDDMYASGSQSPFFGRNFDLAEYALGGDGIEPPCAWFSSSEIPSAANQWSGTNVSGFGSPEYDAACLLAQTTLPDDSAHRTAHRQTQSILSASVPAIPLYYRLRIAAARQDVCNFSLDSSAASLWNIEAIAKGDACDH